MEVESSTSPAAVDITIVNGVLFNPTLIHYLYDLKGEQYLNRICLYDEPAALVRQEAAIVEEVDRELGPKCSDPVQSSASSSTAAPRPQPIMVIPPPFSHIAFHHDLTNTDANQSFL